MRNTSTFVPNLLTPEEVAVFQTAFDAVCAEFGFDAADTDARDRLAEAMMTIARTRHLEVADPLAVARGMAARILFERGKGPLPKD